VNTEQSFVETNAMTCVFVFVVPCGTTGGQAPGRRLRQTQTRHRNRNLNAWGGHFPVNWATGERCLNNSLEGEPQNWALQVAGTETGHLVLWNPDTLWRRPAICSPAQVEAERHTVPQDRVDL